MLVIAPSAYAYDETGSGRACIECHGEDVDGTGAALSGPHGGYVTTSSKCATCHSVHGAADDGILLLPEATVLATCETCHDGTGGNGVYGVIKARTGLDPASAHSMLDLATSIPGGSAVTGGARSATFSGVFGGLTCTDCHSPHGADVVDAFTGDRSRSATDTAGLGSSSGFTSSRLLRRRPTSIETTWAPVTEYGSDWCGACHAGRLSQHADGPMRNHPVDSVDSTLVAPFIYENVAYDTDAYGTLGRTNHGYVMPDKPRNPKQVGHAPICQQCHEDARSVGDDLVNAPGRIDLAPVSEEFLVSATDGISVGDNPRFQVFPHEAGSAVLLLEQGDDLCTNCHPKQGTQP